MQDLTLFNRDTINRLFSNSVAKYYTGVETGKKANGTPAIQNSLPLCNFYKQSVKKHLELLQEIGLIDLIKDDSNNVYFTFAK